MPNTSATGGYLSPVSPAPTSDLALDVQIQGLVAGITGIPGSLVRPRWQPTPPTQPGRDVNWCAVGIVSIDADWGASIVHNPAGEGSDESQTHETLELLASFYGPGSAGLAALLRDGLRIPQNREAMRAQGMAYHSTGTLRVVPSLVGSEWLRRVDLPVVIRRLVSRTYPVLNLLQAQIQYELDSAYTQNSLVPENL